MNVAALLINSVNSLPEEVNRKIGIGNDNLFQQLLGDFEKNSKEINEQLVQQQFKQVVDKPLDEKYANFSLKFQEINKKLDTLVDYFHVNSFKDTTPYKEIESELLLLKEKMMDMKQQVNDFELGQLKSNKMDELQLQEDDLNSFHFDITSKTEKRNQDNLLTFSLENIFSQSETGNEQEIVPNQFQKPLHSSVTLKSNELSNDLLKLLGEWDKLLKGIEQNDSLNTVLLKLDSNYGLGKQKEFEEMSGELFHPNFVPSNQVISIEESKNHLLDTNINYPPNHYSKGRVKNGNEMKLSELMADISKLLIEVNTTKNSKEVAPKILKLLEEWNKHTLDIEENGNFNSLLKKLGIRDVNVKGIWNDILQKYQKRVQVSVRLGNQVETSISPKEIANWLEKSIETYSLKDKAVNSNVNLHTATPLSRLEQYVIHSNQSQGMISNSKSLLNQFQQAIKTSRFMNSPNGVNQLSIKLQPVHLGEIMVRLTQENGEMTVKMIVTSQAAKELLESNIHQLKNMFSPHQVIIEKQENIQLSAQSFKEQNDQENNEHHQEQSDHSDQGNNDPEQEDTKTSFRDLLLNEKV